MEESAKILSLDKYRASDASRRIEERSSEAGAARREVGEGTQRLNEAFEKLMEKIEAKAARAEGWVERAQGARESVVRLARDSQPARPGLVAASLGLMVAAVAYVLLSHGSAPGPKPEALPEKADPP
jgi:hypothetical protein